MCWINPHKHTLLSHEQVAFIKMKRLISEKFVQLRELSDSALEQSTIKYHRKRKRGFG